MGQMSEWPWGVSRCLAPRAKGKMIDVPQKIEEKATTQKGGNLVSKLFLRFLWSLLIPRLPFFLEKKNFKFFKKKNLGSRPLRWCAGVFRYKTNHSFDFSLSGRPGPSSPILRTPSFGGQTLTFACPATTCWKQASHFAGKKKLFWGGEEGSFSLIQVISLNKNHGHSNSSITVTCRRQVSIVFWEGNPQVPSKFKTQLLEEDFILNSSDIEEEEAPFNYTLWP